MDFSKENFLMALCNYSKHQIKNGTSVPAAVLIPLFKSDGQYHILFTKRTDMVENHKGEISFPGGVFDKTDKSLLDTALRESQEELGIDVSDIDVLGELDDIETSTNFIISPFVGIIPYPYEFKVNEAEIEKLLFVPLEHLLDKDSCWEESWTYKGSPYPMYFYRYQGNIIWGATAKIVKGFLEIMEGT